jgi:uroporphyrinogen-III decarboxylase
MANMSYCRFENTYRDLVDCLRALSDSGADSLSDRELQYANMMMQLCEDFHQNYEDEVYDEIKFRKEEVKE